MFMKICTKCKIEKNCDDFYKYKNVCKKCYNENSKKNQKKWREKNREKIKIISKEYRRNNLEKSKGAQKRWYDNNKDKIKDYREFYKKEFPEKLKLTWKKYREENKEKLSMNRKEYVKKHRTELNLYAVNRRKSNPVLKISHNIRGRIRDFLRTKNMLKTNKTFDIIGCSPQQLKEHIEKQFKDGMTWENYGYYGWHIDHIISLNSGKTKEEIYKLCHYTNLQPLWWEDNLSKGDR